MKLSYLTVHGGEVTIALLKCGDAIGDLKADKQVGEETAQALGNVSCYRMAYNDFKALLLRYPALAWQVLEETMSVGGRLSISYGLF